MEILEPNLLVVVRFGFPEVPTWTLHPMLVVIYDTPREQWPGLSQSHNAQYTEGTVTHSLNQNHNFTSHDKVMLGWC